MEHASALFTRQVASRDSICVDETRTPVLGRGRKAETSGCFWASQVVSHLVV